MTYNQRTVTIKLTRSEVIDLLILIAVVDEGGGKWFKLHEKIDEQVKDADEKFSRKE